MEKPHNIERFLYLPLHLQNEQKALEKEFLKRFKTVTYEILKNNSVHILKRICSFKPQVALCQIQGEDQLPLKFFDELKKLGVYVVNWNGDVRPSVPDFMIKLGRKIDLTLITNKTQTLTYEEMGVNAFYWQITFDPEVYQKRNPRTKGYDVVFMGNNYSGFPASEEREELINEAGKSFNFMAFGNGWVNIPNKATLSPLDTSEMCNASKVALGISAFNQLRCYSSDRIFRMMGSGIFYLCRHFKGIEELGFENKKHLVWFHDTKEALELIDYYLNHEKEREKIAQAGYDFVHRNHNPKVRVDELLELLTWEM